MYVCLTRYYNIPTQSIGTSISKKGRDRERQTVWHWSLLLWHCGNTNLCILSHRCVRGCSPLDDRSDILQSSSTIQWQSLLAISIIIAYYYRRALNQVNSSHTQSTFSTSHVPFATLLFTHNSCPYLFCVSLTALSQVYVVLCTLCLWWHVSWLWIAHVE